MEAARSFLPSGEAHPNVIVCGLPDELALTRCLEHLAQLGVRHRPFREPDLGDQLTAIATEPIPRFQKRLFRKYRLLGSSG
ncbi:hypothetical protein AYO44_15175 [Planctomycetaceae bacterium SCGC AG-212-F19]|nr:hypothetical protein AYO44_15175 [Planctomycetaceae bacterium SCGC AG-212-F19]